MMMGRFKCACSIKRCRKRPRSSAGMREDSERPQPWCGLVFRRKTSPDGDVCEAKKKKMWGGYGDNLDGTKHVCVLDAGDGYGWF